MRYYEEVPADVCSYSTLLKLTLLGGVPFFFAMSARCVWLGMVEVPTPGARWMMLGIAAAFGAGGSFGLRLWPFVFAQCWASEMGVHVRQPNYKDRLVPWSALTRVKDWPTLQVLDLWAGEERVLSVDYLMTNFHKLHQQVLARVADRLIASAAATQPSQSNQSRPREDSHYSDEEANQP